MNELKPVAWASKGGLSVFEKGLNDRQFVSRVPCPEQLLTVPLYAIPDTHRVVSVEFLNVVAMIVTEARDYYSDMNDNVCQSYADPWEHAADACRELRAIIDNKEAT